MALFQPCQGKTACRDNGERCLTCGRDLQEIDKLRQCIDALANLAIEYDYQNLEQYCGYVARKLGKTINYRQENP